MKTTTKVELKELKPLYGKLTNSILIAVLLNLANVEMGLVVEFFREFANGFIVDMFAGCIQSRTIRQRGFLGGLRILGWW